MDKERTNGETLILEPHFDIIDMIDITYIVTAELQDHVTVWCQSEVLRNYKFLRLVRKTRLWPLVRIVCCRYTHLPSMHFLDTFEVHRFSVRVGNK